MAIFEKKVIDPRVRATRSIGNSAIAMLALSIPLCAILHSAVLPFAVIGGAAVAMASVWLFGRPKVVATHSKEIAALEATIMELRERLDDVEVISRYEAELVARESAAVTNPPLGEESVETVGRRSMGSPMAE